MPGLPTTMSVRLARLLSVALIGACLTIPAFARSKPKAHTSAPAKSSLVWRGDVATANGVVNEVAKAFYERHGFNVEGETHSSFIMRHA